jgi:hypothetical protein
MQCLDFGCFHFDPRIKIRGKLVQVHHGLPLVKQTTKRPEMNSEIFSDLFCI